MKRIWLALALLSCTGVSVHAGSGTEGAAFLDIPVGGRPAALGAAYTALATDAYAPTWNPAGLGLLKNTQLAGQHLSYLDTLHYEYMSVAIPLPRPHSCSPGAECNTSAIGASVQYLGSGDIEGRDEVGTETGDFSNYYAAYNLAYGHAVSSKLSLGLTGKMIQAQLADLSARAYAVDLGAMYQAQPNLRWALSINHLGSDLKFISQEDPLPLAVHLGAAYQPTNRVMLAAEGVYRKNGLASAHVGAEWHALDLLSLRAGYRTDTLKELSALAGLSTGLGIHVWGQELSYAWLPYGDLGDTHYISLVMKLGESEEAQRRLIHYQKDRRVRVAADAPEPDYEQLMQLLSEHDDQLAQRKETAIEIR